MSRPPLRILYVEDHADIRRAISLVFTSWGHEVRVSRSVAEARGMVGDETFDLLVTDLGLPDGYGLEVLQAWKAARDRPAIALTAHGFENGRDAMLAVGFDYFFVKPPDLGRLRAAIDSLGERVVR